MPEILPLEEPQSTHHQALLVLAGIVLALVLLVVMVSSYLTGVDTGETLTRPLETNKARTIATTQPLSDEIDTGAKYPIVDTNQQYCFDDERMADCQSTYGGQDARYQGNQPTYQDNGDGTVTDLVTGLMWQLDPGGKITYQEAVTRADSFTLAGYDDWRLPTIKELYSLMDFSGMDPSGQSDQVTATPFIDQAVFSFAYGDEAAGDRMIDSQWATSSVYADEVMNGQRCFFGVNFADGRIKCYPADGNKTYYALYVRGDTYGENEYVASDNTVIDQATDLEWMKGDSGSGIEWEEALGYCEDLELANKNDWRLPNAKELQSIVDYSRSPSTSNSPAIDPLFTSTSITNEAGQLDFPYYWTSTTHRAYPDRGFNAVYIAFGRALGYMEQFGGWVDVHGAGAQRSDPKTYDRGAYPQGHGPQGDAVRGKNYVRCVRGGVAAPSTGSTIESVNAPKILQEPNDIPRAESHPKAPQEALTACANKQVGMRCEFQTLQGVLVGSCEHAGGQGLACVPEQR